MKSVFLGLIVSLATLTGFSKPAHAFRLEAVTTVSPNMVTAQVYNTLPAYVNCRVQVVGMLNNGLTETAWAQLSIGPGQYEYAYVYTNYPFYFINGAGQAFCSNAF
jgi:hypothetical protein